MIVTSVWPAATTSPGRTQDLGDGAGDGRFDAVFHLHRFEHDEQRALVDRRTRLDRDADDLARHRRDDRARR